ncbi:unnamed protein product [Blepharisma stoltei]|uniref:ISXO2-like transposase domain-containing protein n=1 Tax=Blepharisma stoltei TaxID=1481888 RepID=A0AAU9K481_9CILI|nr:unnamed protein product [Blepharisma stoltei]
MGDAIPDHICHDHAQNFYDCSCCLQNYAQFNSQLIYNKKLMKIKCDEQLEIKKYLAKIHSLETKLRTSAEEKTQGYLCPTRKVKNQRLVDYLKELPLPHVFFNICKDQELAMAFLLRSGIFPESRKCKSCIDENGYYKEMNFEYNGYMGYLFRCEKCGVKYNVKEGTYWEKCSFTIEKIVLFMFLWVCYMKDNEVAQLLDVTPSCISKLSRKLRKLVVSDFLSSFTPFTGVVEIGTINFVRRKIEIGKGKTPQKWIMILFERGSKNCYIECLPRRSPEYIVPIIQKRCEVGTVVITDKLGCYGRLEDYGFPHYQLDKSRGFEDPDNKFIHHNNLNNIWLWTKYDIKNRYRTAPFLQELLFEWVWRRAHRMNMARSEFPMESMAIFQSLIELIKKKQAQKEILLD